jgi:hypothetical protein
VRDDAAVHVDAEAVDERAALFERHHGLVRERAARPAVGLRNAGAQQPHLAGLAPHAAIGQMLTAPALFERRELALEHLAHVVAEQHDVIGHP